mgnify:CR=1 FL=1
MITQSIAIDAMGGDVGPKVTIPASLDALKKYPNLHIILVGDRHVFEMGIGQAKTEWAINELVENNQPHWGDHDAYPLLSMSTIDEKNVRVAEISEAGVE